MSNAGPVAPGERIHSLDVLRGFALFGVLVANMKGYGWPSVVYEEATFHTGAGVVNRTVEILLLLFVRYKSVTLLSFLFGAGFYLQMSRAERQNANFNRIYIRRSLALLAFGVGHIVLLWWLDILSYYAIAGILLLVFRNRSPESLKRWVLGFAIVAPLLAVGSSALSSGEPVDAAKEFTASIDVHQHGSYSEILRFRLHEFSRESLKLSDFLPTMSMFMVFILMGYWTGQLRILEDVPANLAKIREAFKWGLILGVPVSLMYAFLLAFFSDRQILLGFAELFFSTVGSFLFLSYAAGILLLLQKDVWKQRLSILAPMGRMTLTTYLTQSLICTTIFNGYGLGLYGKVGPATSLLLAATIYILQLFFSRWWLSRYPFGPMEWLWRTLTYGYPHGRKFQRGLS